MSTDPEGSSDPETLPQELARLRTENARLTAENAKLTALLDAVSDVVVLASTDDRLLHLNAAARHAFTSVAGVTVVGDPVGTSVREMGFPSGVLEQGDTLRRDLETTGATVRRELLLPTTSGNRWLENTISPVRDADGTIWGLALICRDVHERKLAEEFRDHMIGVLGHDLRNPLTAISALAALSLRGGPLPDRMTPRLEQIDKAATRALEMIRSLLQFSEGRFHGFALSPEHTDLRDLGRQVIDEITAAHGDRSIELVADGDCTCDCDPARISQVLANLVSNALAHGAADHPVRLAVTRVPDALDIRVTNHGPTIPPDLMGHLFEPFQRGPGATGRPRGLGLGLYIVREIVRAHRGSVTVTSSEPDGTCFRVSLPSACA